MMWLLDVAFRVMRGSTALGHFHFLSVCSAWFHLLSSYVASWWSFLAPGRVHRFSAFSILIGHIKKWLHLHFLYVNLIGHLENRFHQISYISDLSGTSKASFPPDIAESGLLMESKRSNKKLVPADLVEFSTNNEEMKLLVGKIDAR